MDNQDQLAAYDALSKYIALSTLDHHDWWKQTGPMLAKLLSTAKYPLPQQFQYLYLFATHIIPLLGPFPNRPRAYQCILGGLGSLEFSQNFTRGHTTVRIAFDPTSVAACVGLDPCNRGMVSEALSVLRGLSPRTDLQLYHALITELTLTDDEERVLVDKKMLEAQPAKTQTIVALDLKDGDLAVKLYLYPTLKAAATEGDVARMVFDAIRKVDKDKGGFGESLAVVEEYLATAPSSTSVLFLSCDLVAPSRTRFKIYLAEFQVDFDRLSDIWTLGGKRQDEVTQAGVKVLREVWEALEIPVGTRTPPDPASPPTLLPLLFNLEIQPGKPMPEPKIYFPLTGLNDLATAKSLARVFDKWGWEEHARLYTENLASYKPEIDLGSSTDVQAWLSFSYSETGPYVTVYYH